MRKHLFLMASAALALVMGAAGVAAARPKLIPEYDVQTGLTRPIETADDFRAKLSIGIHEDPRLASPARLKEIIEALDLRTPLGRKVTGLIVDPASGNFVGIDRGSMTFVGNLPDGSIIVSVRDASGAFSKAAKDSLAMASPDGKRVCFDLVDIDRSNAKMIFTLLLDRSGSMAGAMDEVLATTWQFLSALPGKAQCTVASFAEDWNNLTPGGRQACGAVRLPRSIAAGGSTDIYGPLSAFYRQYGRPGFETWQKAVIVITDGVVTKNAGEADRIKAGLLKEKGAVKTFVFFLGRHSEEFLAGLADHFIVRNGDIGTYLKQVYGVIGEAYGKQQVLKPRACTP